MKFRSSCFIDVDECQTNNAGCNQTCTDTYGSFECSCGTGYKLAVDDLDCDGNNLTFKCMKFRSSCFIDVDECQTNNGGCNQTCTDTYGSFECSCGTGYILAVDNLDCDGNNLTFKCMKFRNSCFIDVNECQTSNGGCNQTCTNTYGSFECSCGIGYTLAVDNLDCDGKN